MKPQIDAQTSGLTTSGESARQSKPTAARLRQRILDIAREAGERGLTINEAERLIDDHKGHSVSPRFSELARRGLLVRVVIGVTRPTKRFPHGAPRYITRFDVVTRRNVNVHWVPKFAPTAIEPTAGVVRDSSLASMNSSASEHIENFTSDEIQYGSVESLHDSECEYNG